MKAAPPTDDSALRSYTRRKLGVAAQLRALVELLKKRGSEARMHRGEALMVKLAEDRFTLAVLGQFKRGKSSLMNAIIGRELLPTGVLPLTSAITVLKYGPAERLVVRRAASPFPEIVPVSALANYVTEKGNPANRKKVATATLEVPLPFLRRGLEFVDTPGIGSAIEANSATTYAFLPECDAALFVTSVDTPLTAAELEFLRAIREHVGKTFFILNKTDLTPNERERDEVLQFVSERIRAETGAEATRVFPVSARLALTDADGFRRSGMAELQDVLEKFLAEEKATVFLAGVIEKALHIIREESDDGALHDRARALSVDTLRGRLNQLRHNWEELARARRKVVNQIAADTLERARLLSIEQLDSISRPEKFQAHLDRFIGQAGCRLGEEVAERWCAIVVRRWRAQVAQWLAGLTPDLKAAWEERGQENRVQLENNLREISARAASAFQADSSLTSDPLPKIEIYPAFSHRLGQARTIKRSFDWSYLLPARLARRSLGAALQTETARFLAQERNEALTAVADAVRRMADEFLVQLDAAAVALQSRLSATITGEIPPAPETAGDAALEAVRQKLVALREGASVGAEPEPAAPEPASQPNEQSLGERKSRAANPAVDLQTGGCAVCDHLVGAAYDFFAQWQYALASNEAAQGQFAHEHGFCPLHMWQLHAVSSPLGESIGLARLVERTSESLKRTNDFPTSQPPAAHEQDCRVCHLLSQAEASYIVRLAAFLDEDNGRDTYSRSQGVCLRHLALLLPKVNEGTGKFLRREAIRHFDECAEEMQSYAVKREALRRTLGHKNEEDAHLRALIHFTGAKDLSTPWPEDREI